MAWRLGYPHPDQMLAGLNSRQLSEMYAFAAIEPLDQPLQNMIAQLTDVLARVHGNDTTHEDFLLVRRVVSAAEDAKLRSQQLMDIFLEASRKNEAAQAP